MKIARSIDEIPRLPLPCGLSIGSFDGVHLGHQTLIKRLRSLVGDNGTVAVLTFSNHPSQVLQHRPPPQLIYPLEQKLRLFEGNGVDLVILLEFSPSIASETYDHFLKNIHDRFPFSYLVLGEGAKLGKKKEGDEQQVKPLGQTLGFTAEYLPKLKIEGEIVSSGRIRQLLYKGDFKTASLLLGRPYSDH